MTFKRNKTVEFEGLKLKTFDDIDNYFKLFYGADDITIPPDPEKIPKHQHTDETVK